MQNNKQTNNKIKLKSGMNSVEYGKFTGNYKNDGISGEFDGLTYPHSQEMLKVYKILIFGINLRLIITWPYNIQIIYACANLILI